MITPKTPKRYLVHTFVYLVHEVNIHAHTYGTWSSRIFSWTKFFKSHKFFIWIGNCNALSWLKSFIATLQNFG